MGTHPPIVDDTSTKPVYHDLHPEVWIYRIIEDPRYQALPNSIQSFIVTDAVGAISQSIQREFSFPASPSTVIQTRIAIGLNWLPVLHRATFDPDLVLYGSSFGDLALEDSLAWARQIRTLELSLDDLDQLQTVLGMRTPVEYVRSQQMSIGELFKREPALFLCRMPTS